MFTLFHGLYWWVIWMSKSGWKWRDKDECVEPTVSLQVLSCFPKLRLNSQTLLDMSLSLSCPLYFHPNQPQLILLHLCFFPVASHASIHKNLNYFVALFHGDLFVRSRFKYVNSFLDRHKLCWHVLCLLRVLFYFINRG